MDEKTTVTIDVRQIPPPQRHPKIFQTFDGLTSGQSFILINDHDPKPLYYQFIHEREGQFGWEYQEEGPETWRVQISRTAGANEGQT
jgi:uncharacterized protein (DUF2249 family)